MNKKRIKQMNTLLLRRLNKRPAAEYFEGHGDFLRALERENYMQRFAPLLNGGRIRCTDVLGSCRGELAQLCPDEPRDGWLLCAYDTARRLLFPEKGVETSCGVGAVFLLSVLQVLFDTERELLPFDSMWDFDFRERRRTIVPARQATPKCCGCGSASTFTK